METIEMKWTGVAPLLQHNGQTTDPMNRFSRAMAEINAKRKKTEADHAERDRLEFLAGLYLNSEQQVIVPSHLVEATLIGGAKKVKMGPAAKAGLIVDEDALLDYGDQIVPENLLGAGYVLRVRVKVGQSAVMRTRPMFRQWSIRFRVLFNDEIISARSILEAARHAGQSVGLGDWRPKYGRFTVEQV